MSALNKLVVNSYQECGEEIVPKITGKISLIDVGNNLKEIVIAIINNFTKINNYKIEVVKIFDLVYDIGTYYVVKHLDIEKDVHITVRVICNTEDSVYIIFNYKGNIYCNLITDIF